MAARTMVSTLTEHVRIEDRNEGGVGHLFGLDQATMIDDQLSLCDHLQNKDQREFGRVLKGLQSQKSLENDQLPSTTPKAHVF